MSFVTDFKATKAIRAHGRNRLDEAYALYGAAYAAGMNKAKHLLPYAILLLRRAEYEKAAEVLRKAEKAPGGLTPAQRNQMLTHYAVASWRLGRLDYAIELLREVFRKGSNGNIYGTLGYLLVEKGDFEEALAFNKEAVEYDDEDPIMLDNLAQTYYRLGDGGEDKARARKLFEKALGHRPGSIDTNYFLALYDLEEGDKEAAREKLQLAGEGKFSPLNYASPEMVAAKLREIDS